MLDATGAGMILGTAPYMSPEQARGRRVDKRADIWAWGCVVYEMLTGDRLFMGESISDVLAAVLRQDIELDSLPAATPAELRYLIERALERESADRLRDIGEARIALEGAGPRPESPPAPARKSPVALAAAMVAGLALGAGATWWFLAPPVASVLQLDIAPPGLQTGALSAPRIAPDGQSIVFRADDRLWVRSLGQVNARPIPDVQRPEIPFWSPDSREIAYHAEGSLWRHSLEDGATVEMSAMPVPASGGRGTWDPAGRMLVAQGSTELFSIPARGGELVPLFFPDPAREEGHFHGTIVLPDGALVFIVHRLDGTADTIAASRDGERETILTLEGDYLADLAYSPEGALLFSRTGQGGNGVWIVPFDAGALAVTGEPTMMIPNGTSPSLSLDGTRLLHLPDIEGMWQQARARVGVVENLSMNAPGTGFRQLTDYMPMVAAREGQRISPDGTELVLSILDGGRSDLWLIDLQRGSRRRLTDDSSFAIYPVWSTDGRWVYFHTQRHGHRSRPGGGRRGRGSWPRPSPGRGSRF